jgi:hypothetical protein
MYGSIVLSENPIHVHMVVPAHLIERSFSSKSRHVHDFVSFFYIAPHARNLASYLGNTSTTKGIRILFTVTHGSSTGSDTLPRRLAKVAQQLLPL